MKILELFAGTRSIGVEFEKRGHDVFSIDWERSLPDIDLYCDIEFLTVEQLINIFGIPDVIWASPDCTTYSIMGVRTHRNWNRSAKTEYAQKCDRINYHLWSMITDFLKLNPKLIYFVENPVGLYRKMDFARSRQHFTVTYCQYGDHRRKPTDIFTNIITPGFRPACHNGDSCHDAAPRHTSNTGTCGMPKKDRSRIPEELANHIVDIAERGPGIIPGDQVSIWELL